MVIGIDMGASAVKLAALENGEVVLSHYESGRGGDVPALCSRLGLDLKAARAVTVMGLSARKAGLEATGISPIYVSEPEAIGRGAMYLTGLDNIVIASIGTGTAFVHAKGGEFKHLCGTGVGAGTLNGLAERMLGVTDMREFDRMAMAGDTNQVDLTIGDFVEMHGQLAADLTASNLARRNAAAGENDWAAGLATLIFQVIGTMSLIACQGCGAESVVITGAIADSEPSRANFRRFTEGYGIEYIVPENSTFATAIGAALCAGNAG